MAKGYETYLAGPVWKRIRARVLERDCGKCRGCSGIATEVHHGSYDKQTMLGADLSRLYAICRPCHLAITFNVNGEKRAWTEVDEMTRAMGGPPPRPEKVRGERMKARIKALQSKRGGWTRESLAKLGVRWPPTKGWKKRLIRGK